MTILACDVSAASELVARVLQIIDADGSHVANGTSRYRRTIQWKRQRPLNLARPSKVTQAIVFDDKDIDVLSLTNLCSLFSYGLQNGRDIAWRVRDQAQNLAHRRQLAGEPHDLGFLAGSGRTAMAHSLQGFRPAAGRVSQLAACFGAPSHRHPEAQHYADLQVGLQQGFATGEMGSMINLRSLSPSPSGRQRSDLMSFQASIISFVLQPCR